MDRYTLVATKVAPAGMAQGSMSNFAGAIPQNQYTDPGRRWAGDPYTTGPATDPAEAFAHFSGAEGVDAWLDKQDDGTLVGWVRDGQEVWRYTDPNTWASDVDAAQMSRVDAPAAPEAEALPNADDTAIPSNQAASDFGPDTPDEENPFLMDESETMDAAAAEHNDGAADEQAALPGDSPTAQDPNIDPEADPQADPQAAPDAEPDAEPDADEAPAAEEADPAEPEDDADEDDEDKKANPFAKTEKKHLPGHHDQREHGNWAHGIHVNHSHLPDGTPVALPRGGGPGPKAPEPAAPAPAKPKAPAKASLAHDTLDRLSVDDLEGIWASGDSLYDQDTLSHVAMLLDEKNPLDASSLPDDPAGELGAFAGVIPDEYVHWVARNSKHAPQAKQRSKREQIEQAYQDYLDAQYQQAAAATKGVLWSRQGEAWARQHGKDEMSLFNGSVTRPQIKKYASEELLRYFAEHPRMTFQQFASEFYPSYAKATAHLKGAYLSEHG